jgi:predicted cobalt transporter CbtA
MNYWWISAIVVVAVGVFLAVSRSERAGLKNFTPGGSGKTGL